MADGFVVLSGSTCACPTGFCGITPWYRWKFQWSRGDLVPSAQIGTTSERVGQTFNQSNSERLLTDSWENVTSNWNECCDGLSGTNVVSTSFVIQSFAKGSYGNSSTYMRYTFAGNGVNGGYALFDVDVNKYITNNPTATTLSVRTFIGTWYYIINNFTSPSFINASGQSFFDYANYSYYITNYCCALAYTGAGWYGYTCSACDNHTYLTVRGGAQAQLYYGNTSFSSSEVLGYASGATISVAVAMYNKDPNTAGAQVIAGDFNNLQNVATVYTPTSFSTPYVTTIDLKTLSFSIA